jgi:hypothetical protein
MAMMNESRNGKHLGKDILNLLVRGKEDRRIWYVEGTGNVKAMYDWLGISGWVEQFESEITNPHPIEASVCFVQVRQHPPLIEVFSDGFAN